MAILGGLPWSHFQKPSVSPEELLPAESVLYVGWSGVASQHEAYGGSALHDVMENTSLGKFLAHVSEAVFRAAGVEEPASARELWSELCQHGVVGSLSFTTEPRISPVLTFVFPGAGTRKWPENLSHIMHGLAESSQEKTLAHDSRTIHVITGRDGEQFAWWIEGDHLVVTVLAANAELPTSVAVGRQPNLRSNAAFLEFQPPASSPAMLQIWSNIERVTALMIDNNSGAETLNKLGFDGIKRLNYAVALQGREVSSELRVQAPSPRRGIVKILLDQPTLTLADLPPLPDNTTGFAALGIDLTPTVYDVLDLIKRVGGLSDEQLEQAFADAEEALGLRVREDLLLALGQKLVNFDAGNQVIPGIGAGLAIEVKDSDVMRRLAARVAQLIEESAEGQVGVFREELGDVEIFRVELPEELPFPIQPTWSVTDGWVVLGFAPDAVRSFVECQSGTRGRWQPDATFAQARAGIPTAGNWLTWNDPRSTVEALLGIVPGLIEQMNQDPGAYARIDASLLPSAEQVNQHLFHSHAAMVADSGGMRWFGKSAVPMIGFGNPDTISVGALGVALLLPAAPQARDATRRAQDRNNLDLIGRALHNHHDAFMAFPGATMDAPGLKPEKRLSWLASILPSVGDGDIFQALDVNKPWDDPSNHRRNAQVATYLNPKLTETVDANGNGLTHYAGMAGVGADAAELAKNDPRAGVFGYNRKTAMADITDGAANTIMVMDVNGKLGPWAAGGSPTLRALTSEPYFNGPDGIGGNFAGGANFLFADGSVRFINKNVDPQVMRALATIAGNE
jgi:prepilin-type processing-associated H-X9-DG protein